MRFSEEIQPIYDSLKPKQKEFINAYLTNGYNGTRAALAAGYSKDVCYQQAYENLNKPDIKVVLDSMIESAAIRAGVTQDFLFNERMKMLDTCRTGEKYDASGVDKALEGLAKLSGLNAPDKTVSKSENKWICSDDREEGIEFSKKLDNLFDVNVKKYQTDI